MKPRFLGILSSLCLFAALFAATIASVHAQATLYGSSADFTKYAMKLRDSAILHMEPTVVIFTNSRTMGVSERYPWKTGIVTTVFWIGEPAGGNNPVHNVSSSWDLNWMQSYGGYDNPDPAARRNFVPTKFSPRQNPFYVALPYNDVARGMTKPEARQVIPWFKDAFEAEGKSVCRDHWVAIRNNTGKICYAQWSDCGPFRTDHWQYVFGNEKPKPNLNQGAGLDIAPAVRDYLNLGSTDVTDWKFVDASEVPSGPWDKYGDNNTVALRARQKQENLVKAAPLPMRTDTSSADRPTVITR